MQAAPKSLNGNAKMSRCCRVIFILSIFCLNFFNFFFVFLSNENVPCVTSLNINKLNSKASFVYGCGMIITTINRTTFNFFALRSGKYIHWSYDTDFWNSLLIAISFYLVTGILGDLRIFSNSGISHFSCFLDEMNQINEIIS